MTIKLDMYQTMAAAVLVYYVGVILKRHIAFFDKYCIPSPLIGGFVFAIVNCLLYVNNICKYSQDRLMQDFFMSLFFTSLGYSASLKAGKNMFATGSTLVAKMTLIVTALVALQDFLGVGLAKAFGLNPLLGLATGSIPMIGGHGTAGAFGPVLESLGLENGTTIAFAAATFGLVAGGIIGGPVGNRLIRKYKLVSEATLEGVKLGGKPPVPVEDAGSDTDVPVGVTADEQHFMYGFAHLLLAMGLGTIITHAAQRLGLVLPNYIGAMLMAALLRNFLEMTRLCKCYPQEASILGNMGLNLFLSLALMGMRLWHLAYLAVPLFAILVSQTLLMAFFATYVTFNVMGRNYEAAVMASGNCGFGLGATPNALANMKAITERFGPAPTAFFVIPLVGALLIDMINTGIILVFINVLK